VCDVKNAGLTVLEQCVHTDV